VYAAAMLILLRRRIRSAAVWNYVNDSLRTSLCVRYKPEASLDPAAALPFPMFGTQ
jgi:hypothetical protein